MERQRHETGDGKMMTASYHYDAPFKFEMLIMDSNCFFINTLQAWGSKYHVDSIE